jgi:hypothetical protein
MDNETRIVHLGDRVDIYDLPWHRYNVRCVYVAVSRKRLYVRIWIRAWCIWLRAKK